MKNIFIGLLFCLPCLLNAQVIDSEKSKVKFEIDAIAWTSVEGEIKGMQGELYFDSTNLDTSYFNVCINPTSVNTENKKRDEHLRSADFFNVETYLTICLKSKRIQKSNDGFEVVGDLTMHGVTKEVTIPFTFDGTTFCGKITINRFDFNLAAASYKRTGMVGEEADVEIICVLKSK